MEGRLFFDRVDLKRSRSSINHTVKGSLDVLPVPTEPPLPLQDFTSPKTEMTSHFLVRQLFIEARLIENLGVLGGMGMG